MFVRKPVWSNGPYQNQAKEQVAVSDDSNEAHSGEKMKTTLSPPAHRIVHSNTFLSHFRYNPNKTTLLLT